MLLTERLYYKQVGQGQPDGGRLLVSTQDVVVGWLERAAGLELERRSVMRSGLASS